MTHRLIGSLPRIGALVSVSCSSSGSDGGGGGTFDCNGCDKIIAAGCPNDDKATCVKECQDDLAQAGSCSSQMSGLYNCLLGTPLTCSPNGEATPDQAAIGSKCASQAIAGARCSACTVDSGDDACDTCEKQSCCNETKAIYDDANFMAYYQCYSACPDTCKQACAQQYPSITEKGAAVAACTTSKARQPARPVVTAHSYQASRARCGRARLARRSSGAQVR
jgi:hypothetical protein